MNYLVAAIHKIKPDAQFLFTDEDYSTIQWVELEGTAPTKAQINAAIAEIKAEEEAAQTAKSAAAASATAKLEAIGLTAAEIAALRG
jgi:hypothetical protein